MEDYSGMTYGGEGSHWDGCEKAHWDCKIAHQEKLIELLWDALADIKFEIDFLSDIGAPSLDEVYSIANKALMAGMEMLGIVVCTEDDVKNITSICENIMGDLEASDGE